MLDQIVPLVRQRVTYNGVGIAGSDETVAGFCVYLAQKLSFTGDAIAQQTALLNWLKNLTAVYEADDAVRMKAAATVQQAPSNAISSQTSPQVMQPPAAAAPPAETEEVNAPALACPDPSCKTTAKGLRGIKRHVTQTHQADWPAFCSRYGADPKTGLPGASAPQQQTLAVATPPPPAAPPVPPMFQASGPPAPFVAPPPPPLPIVTGGQTGGVSSVQPTTPAWGVPAQQQMPVPPAVVPAQPIPAFPTAPAPGPVVMFDPAQVTVPAQPPAWGMPAGIPATAPQPPPPPTTFQPMQQMLPQAPVSFPAAVLVQPAPAPGAPPSRAELAKMLGGEVDLIVVRLLDAGGINLTGRADVNQLAMLAEKQAKAEMKINDLAQGAYSAGKQAAQRHFGQLLNSTPGCYLFMNGYEPIIPDGYLPILVARVTKLHNITDGGNKTDTIVF